MQERGFSRAGRPRNGHGQRRRNAQVWDLQHLQEALSGQRILQAKIAHTQALPRRLGRRPWVEGLLQWLKFCIDNTEQTDKTRVGIDFRPHFEDAMHFDRPGRWYWLKRAL